MTLEVVREVELVPISLIEPFDSPSPSKDFMESVKALGQIAPAIVVKTGEESYRIVCGRRRTLALKELGIECLEAIVIDADEERERQLIIAENMQRSSNWAVEAEQFDTFRCAGLAAKEIAKIFNVSDALVSQRLAILSLIPELFDLVKRGEMAGKTAWHAHKLPQEEQETLWHRYDDTNERITLKEVLEARRDQELAMLDCEGIEVPYDDTMFMEVADEEEAEDSIPVIEQMLEPYMELRAQTTSKKKVIGRLAYWATDRGQELSAAERMILAQAAQIADRLKL